jgi:hypothetical protein
MVASAVATDRPLKLKEAETGRKALDDSATAASTAGNPAPVSAAAAGGFSGSIGASLKAERRFGISQRFARVASETKATTAHPVLASFQVEQSGTDLRIVDGDGSVYTGHLQPSGAAVRSRAMASDAASAPAAAQAPKDSDTVAAPLEYERLLAQTYTFQVTGTNRSLKKKVVFSGSLLPAPHTNKAAPMSTNLVFLNRTDGFQMGSSRLGPVPLVNTRISGEVVVGKSKAVQVNAEPVSP